MVWVHGHRRQIRPRRHGGEGQVLVEIKVGAVGLVGQTEHPAAVGQVHNALEVGADAVVGGIVDQNGLGVRVFL